MSYYLLLSRSITHAQRMNSMLGMAGIPSKIFRPPVGLTDKGCSYAIKVTEKGFEPAIIRLRESELLPVRVFHTAGDGAYHEIRPR